MASEYDYETTFTFRKPQDFWVHLNKQMVIKDRDTLNDDGLYHLILFSSLPKDPNECIDSNGCLKQSATGMTKITSGYTILFIFFKKFFLIYQTWFITSIYKTRARQRTRSGDTSMVLI